VQGILRVRFYKGFGGGGGENFERSAVEIVSRHTYNEEVLHTPTYFLFRNVPLRL